MKSFFGHLAVDAPESDRKDLLSELKVMKTFKPHPHVIKLLGCVTESGKELTKILSFVLDSIVILDLISHSYHWPKNMTCVYTGKVAVFVTYCPARSSGASVF